MFQRTEYEMKTWVKAVLVGAAGLVVLLGGVAGAISAMDSRLPQSLPGLDVGQQLPPANPPQGLQFSVLPTSTSKGSFEALIVGTGSWLKHRSPVHVAVLVQHPQGTFLFDTGLGRKVASQFAENKFLDRQLFAFGQVDPVVDQLSRAGWTDAQIKSQIKSIVPSHMHWDHISGLPDFPDAQVWVSPQELAHAQKGHAPAFLASQFEGVRHWHDLRMDAKPYLGFAQSWDMFGDGSVVFVSLNGHTAGQVGMFLNLPSGKRYFFTGDTTWTLEGLQWPADRSWLLRQLVHLDQDEADNHNAIVHVHQIMQRFPDVTIVPAHDENVLRSLPRFPTFQH